MIVKVRLKGQDEPVTLTHVERDDDYAVVGTTPSGKRFVAPRESVRPMELPSCHPYRVYLRGGAGLRAVDPPFEAAEEWLVDTDVDSLTFTTAEGDEVDVPRKAVLSILSPTPEDAIAAQAAMN